MKILVLNSILYTPNRFVHKVNSIRDTMIYNMCLGFKLNGHEVTLAAAAEYEPTVDNCYDFEVFFFKSAFKRLFKPTVLPFSISLLQYLRKNHAKYDLVISSEVFAFPSLFASIICPEKTIIWHELALHPSLLFELPSKFWYNFICRIFMRDVFVIPRSEGSKRFISSYCRNVSEVCVEHGINLKKINYSKEKESYFTYVGQLIPRKNVDYIIDVFAKYLSCTKTNIILYICGDGPLMNKLKNYAKLLKIDDKVIFTGNLKHQDLNKIVMHSRGCLIATKQDNNMVSIPESIVSGTPILTNSVPTNSYIIKNNKLGIVKDGWGVKELIRLYEDSDLIDNCILYRDKLSIQYSSQSLIDIFRNSKN